QQVDRVGRHRRVGLARGPHHGRVGIVPQVEPRVDRDAVAAYGDAGQVDVTVRLTVAGLDHLEHVDAVPVTESGELVRQSDVDVAIGGLGELGELGGLGRAEVPHAVGSGQDVALVAVQYRAVELDRAVGAAPVEAADQLRVLAQGGGDPPGEDALGAVHVVEVAPGGQRGTLLEHRCPPSARRAL